MFKNTLCILILISMQSRVRSVNVTFIIVVIGENPLYGYYAALPYFESSFAEVAKTYPTAFANTTRRVLYKPGNSACPDAAAAMNILVGEIYQIIKQSQSFNVILAPGCSLELVPLGDFAREVNVPLLASTSTDAMFANVKRYSTFLSFGSTGQGGHAAAIKAFLDYYNWTTVTLFCDAFSAFPTVAAFLGAHCRSITFILNVAGKYSFYLESYDSKFGRDYEARLLRAKRQSRIVIILARADELQKIMVLAHTLNMTNSEFVFLHCIPVQGPDYVPIQIDTGTVHDKDIFEAYKSLITLNFPLPDYVELAPFTDSVALNSQLNFHHNYTIDEKNNEITLAIPEMMTAVGEVLNEFDKNLAPLDTTTFRKAFLNRYFRTNVRPLIMGGLGMRLCDSVFSRLNVTTRKFESAWYYNFASTTLQKTSLLADDWNGAGVPPLNEPMCGYRGDRCLLSDNITAVIAGSVCGIVSAAAIIFSGFYYFIKKSTKFDQSGWWMLEPQSFVTDGNKPTVNVGVQTMQINSECLWLRTESINTRDGDILLMPSIRVLFSQLRQVRHQNISHFRGIIILTPSTTSVVWDGGRGTLRLFLSKEAIISDAIVQLHLVFNIISGLQYVHLQTPFRFHGSLSSMSVILDSRFTAKLCDIASKSFYQILYKSPFIITEQDVMVGPERKVAGSPEMDIFALGVIIYEILRGSKISPSETLDINAIKYENMPFQLAVTSVISQCTAADRLARPTIKQVIERLSSFQPKGNVVASILERLERHAEHLEHTVAHRTQELLLERQKVDVLLAEIIPPSIVSKLRNKIIVPPERFEAVTILFSSMVGFDLYCKAKSPLEVGVFLNELYTFIDGYLASFNVYKVETIKDGYVVASGVPIRNGDEHAKEIAQFALLVLGNCTPDNLKHHLPIRIGIHTGPIAAGVVGSVMPRYCLFGDTMNTASRMESHGEESKIHVSPAAKEYLAADKRFNLQCRGSIMIKGKGLIETFWLSGAT
ncbi:atrial natriuretic peptide receptor 1-like isoform X2 [Paramacrobiotus metropolitanus]|uniref:atrial natriuretic peptide receptor 1-like isoform X2 n=1 Tax=Paramacrobiotus metropolitanus TaxID=2943436 RepID=UPI002445887E|nr:atrial natriuretic peptide receptor 1-like isoform X2 [Paramacrobiotus metropolitanus]